MNRLAVVTFGALLAACPSPAKPPALLPTPVAKDSPTPPPITLGLEPAQPTLRLPRNFTPTSYVARLALDPSKTGFTGEIAITGAVSERSTVIWLHGRSLSVTHAVATQGTTSQALEVTPKGEDLLEVRASSPLDAGAWTLQLDYAGDYDLRNTAGAFKQTVAGDDYVFSQLEAIYARRVFPCFDEPDVKVPWQLTLDVPSKLVAVSNTAVASEAALDATHTRVTFAPTKPLPSYLIAFGVGPFDVVDAGKTRSGVPVRAIALHGRAADAAYAAKTTPLVLDLLEDWFQIPYPYDKLDVLAVPLTVGFSAMENAGLVTYTESVMLLDPKRMSRGRQHRWATTCAHELAHQWFGDFVTMAWWDDIWLNEGFADWMERKITQKLEPAWHDELGDLQERDRALDADALVSARRIRQPIETPDDILDVFDGITYAKGASVLAMFEQFVGPEVFARGVRDYLHSRAFGNATSADFVGAISRASGQDLGPAFATFLEQGGAPELDAQIACDRGARVELTQRRYVPIGAPAVAAGTPWIVPVCVAYDKDGARGEACGTLGAEHGIIELPAKACPRWVMPNVHGRGYYHLVPTTAQVSALRDEAWPLLDWTERRAVFEDVSDLAEQSKLSLTLALSLVPKMLAGGDRYSTAQATGFVRGFRELVPQELRGKYEAWVRQTYGPAASKIGLEPKDGEDLDAETSRGELVGIVMGTGRDPALNAQAVKLAERWRDLPQAIRGLVLGAAAETSPDVFARVLRDIHDEPDRARRGDMLYALGVRDIPRQKQALALVLDAKLDIRETMWLMFESSTVANREVAQQFFRDHQAEIMGRLPTTDTTSQSVALARLFTATCDAGKRDAVVAYVRDTFGKLAGAERPLALAIEGMDQCIARRARLEPELRGWLSGIKTPKPNPKK